MSTRILKLGVGRPYEHHFTDDLESFFWLILWCVVEHVDDQDASPTETAQDILQQLDRQSLKYIGVGKAEILSQCLSKGRLLKKNSAECGNSWAIDPMVTQVLVKIESFFAEVYLAGSFMECTPSEVFPELIKILKDGLGM